MNEKRKTQKVVVKRIEVIDKERRALEGTEKVVLVEKQDGYECYKNVETGEVYMRFNDYSVENGTYAIVDFVGQSLLKKLYNRLKEKDNTLTRKPR